MWERSWRAEVHCVATPERVWAVLVDFDAYPRWNPFTPAIACGAVGEPVRLTVDLGGRSPRIQEERLVVWDPPHQLSWSLDHLPRWLLHARRDQRLSVEGSGTRYETVDVIGGLLGPVVAWWFGPALERGFTRMADALAVEVAARVEAGL